LWSLTVAPGGTLTIRHVTSALRRVAGGGELWRSDGSGRGSSGSPASKSLPLTAAERAGVSRRDGSPATVEVAVLVVPEEENGWKVLATAVSAERCADGEILQAYREQNTTVEPGLHWIKNPAAISPVWLEKPERTAALAMLTVVGLLLYRVLQR